MKRSLRSVWFASLPERISAFPFQFCGPTHVDDRDIEWLKAYCDVHFRGIERATDIATESLDRRLAAMNEFRDQLRDQAGTFITRDEYNGLVNSLASAQATAQHEIGIIRIRLAGLDTRVYLGGAGIILIISVFQFILNYWHPGR